MMRICGRHRSALAWVGGVRLGQRHHRGRPNHPHAPPAAHCPCNNLLQPLPQRPPHWHWCQWARLARPALLQHSRQRPQPARQLPTLRQRRRTARHRHGAPQLAPGVAAGLHCAVALGAGHAAARALWEPLGWQYLDWCTPAEFARPGAPGVPGAATQAASSRVAAAAGGGLLRGTACAGRAALACVRLSGHWGEQRMRREGRANL